MTAQPRPTRAPRERGQGVLEYSLAIALVAVIVIALLHVVGGRTAGAFCQTASGLNGNQGGCNLLVVGGDGSTPILGDGTQHSSLTPVSVPSLTSYAQAIEGGAATAVLKYDGTVWMFGWNQDGRLGNGNFTTQNSLVQVSNLSNVTAIAGRAFFGAVRNDASDNAQLFVWGPNAGGEMGNGTTCPSWPCGQNTPSAVPGMTGVSQVSMLGSAMVLKSDGTLWTWGANKYGQDGTGTASTNTCQCIATPQQVTIPSSAKIVQIVAAASQDYAVMSDGTVWAWGYNGDGELGNGTCTDAWSPQIVPGLSGIASIADKGNNVVALASDGTVYSWGDNDYGQVGTNSTATVTCTGGSSNQCQCVSTPQHLSLTGISGVYGACYGAFARTSNGTVYAWGWNAYGQLGLPDKNDRHVPTVVPAVQGMDLTGISSDYEGTLFLGRKPA